MILVNLLRPDKTTRAANSKKRLPSFISCTLLINKAAVPKKMRKLIVLKTNNTKKRIIAFKK